MGKGSCEEANLGLGDLVQLGAVIAVAAGLMLAANQFGPRGDLRYLLLFALFAAPLAIGIILRSGAGRDKRR